MLTRRDFLRVAAKGALCLSFLPLLPRRSSAQDLGWTSPIRSPYYIPLEGEAVQCTLCPRGCVLEHGERGHCEVRENRHGELWTLAYANPCALHIDPIEKKPFFHVLPGETALSFATAGCNVECKFCQNWEISQFRPEQVRAVWLPPAAMVDTARRSGAPLLAATYSEPVIFWEFVRDVSREAKRHGLRSLVVSNGYIQEQPLREVLPLLTAYKVDLKSFRETFYREVVRGELKPVLDTLERIRKAGTWLEIVVLIIPTLNDSEDEARDLCRWVKASLGPEVPVHFTRFHPTYRMTDLPPTPVATIERLWKIGKAEGLHFAYVGNSILGRDVNLGAGTRLSNLKITEDEVRIPLEGRWVPTGMRKLGAILGDRVKTGCNCVLNPGALLGPGCLVYPNLTVQSGWYPPGSILKLRQQLVRGQRR